jgi:hypothetical protein
MEEAEHRSTDNITIIVVMLNVGSNNSEKSIPV